MTSPVVQAGSSSGKRSEPGNSGNSPRELATGPGHAVPQGSRGPTQPAGTPAADSNRGSAPPAMGAPAADSRRVSAPASVGAPAADSKRSSTPSSVGAAAADSRRSSGPAPSGAAALGAIPEKPRDPRLASLASRTEGKGKEQPLNSPHSAQSTPGSAAQQGLHVSSAARDQVCRTENGRKAHQTAGQCSVLPPTPPSAQHEGDRRAAASKSGSRAPSEGGQSSGSEWNKDSRGVSRRPSQESPESTESSSAKRRKFFH